MKLFVVILLSIPLIICNSYCVHPSISALSTKSSFKASRSPLQATSTSINTRIAIQKTVSSLLVLIGAFSTTPSFAVDSTQQFDPALEVRVVPPPPKSKRPFAWSVEMADPQYLQPRTEKGEKSLLTRLVNSKVVLFGDHRGSDQDHQLEINLLERMIKINPNRKIVLASQAFPQIDTIDEALAEFSTSKPPKEFKAAESVQDDPTVQKLIESVQKEIKAGRIAKEGFMEVEKSLPLLLFARDHSIPIVALDLPTEIQTRLKKEGLSGLTEEDRARYLIDPTGFIAAVQNPAYKTYTEDILQEQFETEYSEYSLTRRLQQTQDSEEILQKKEKEYKKVFENYVSSKMFQHEAIATRLLATLLSSPSSGTPSSVSNFNLYKMLPATLPPTERPAQGETVDPALVIPTIDQKRAESLPLVVASVHEEDVVYHYGIEERIKRLKTLFINPRDRPKYFYNKINELLALKAATEGSGVGKGPKIQISDEIRVTGVVDLKDDIYSVLLNPTAIDSHTRLPSLRLGLAMDDDFVNDRTLSDFLWFSDWPAVKLLTRPQNPISREGEKPDGQTSILGVF